MDLPFLPAASATPGFKPRCRVAPPAPAAGGGGLLDMAMSLLSAPAPDPWADHLTQVDVLLAPAPAVSHARLTLTDRDGAPQVAAGDALRVELGEEGALAGVLQGEVLAVEGEPGARRTVVLASAAVKLARRRENAGHRSRTLTDLLKTFAASVGLTSGALEAGGRFEFLAIDDRRSLWEWAGLLAAQADLLVWTDGDGALRCTKPGGPPLRTYTYAQDVLALEHRTGAAALGALTVMGEGAAGSQGASAWSWLVKDPAGVTGSAGGGDPARVQRDGTLRSAADVRAAAQAGVRRAIAAASRISLRVPGSPDLIPGATLKLAGCPGGRGDGAWVIETARHRYARGGYVAQIEAVAA
jgi:hypothetical protein